MVAILKNPTALDPCNQDAKVTVLESMREVITTKQDIDMPDDASDDASDEASDDEGPIKFTRNDFREAGFQLRPSGDLEKGNPTWIFVQMAAMLSKLIAKTFIDTMKLNKQQEATQQDIDECDEENAPLAKLPMMQHIIALLDTHNLGKESIQTQANTLCPSVCGPDGVLLDLDHAARELDRLKEELLNNLDAEVDFSQIEHLKDQPEMIDDFIAPAARNIVQKVVNEFKAEWQAEHARVAKQIQQKALEEAAKEFKKNRNARTTRAGKRAKDEEEAGIAGRLKRKRVAQ